jgi:hypothetical protein
VIKDWREADEAKICLLLVVVRMRRSSEMEVGRYEATLSVRSVMLAVEGRVKERVDGSDRPGNDESRTLTFDAILYELLSCEAQMWRMNSWIVALSQRHRDKPGGNRTSPIM